MRAVFISALLMVAVASAIRPIQRLRADTPAPTDPVKPVWPPKFDAPFGLNVKSSNYTNVTSHFYYDWGYNHNSLITYPDKCLPALTDKMGCNLVFNDNGTWMFTPINKSKPITKENSNCCHLFKTVGSLPPAFLNPFNFSGVDHFDNMYGQKVKCNKWHNFGFAYWTAVDGGADIGVRDGPGDVFWNYGTLAVNPIPHSYFDVPYDTCAKSCLPGKHLKAGANPTPEDLGPMTRQL